MTKATTHLPIHKYPRTHHVEGSRLQPGDEDLEQVPFSRLAGCHLVVEEKLDGANAGISFARDGTLLLQSRGHYLRGGPRERQFDLLKRWAHAHRDRLFELLGSRYVLYGEWLYAKHTVYYDALPHYFMEFDLLDTTDNTFCSTPRRDALLDRSLIVAVPVLHSGEVDSVARLREMIDRSLYKSDSWWDALVAACRDRALDEERVSRETDHSDDSEGLYIKVEASDQVVGRYKYIRPSFFTAVVDSESHWLDRPLLPNGLSSDGRLVMGLR